MYGRLWPSDQAAEETLAGWLENAVCARSGEAHELLRRNRIVRQDGFMFLDCAAETAPADPSAPRRADILFDDFERETYESWTAKGTAFGTGPIAKGKVPDYQGDLALHGQRAVNSHSTAPGDTVGGKDAATGTLTSKPFTIFRRGSSMSPSACI